VNYQTFRDKTLPGSEEKWTLKINGYKKEAVAAELLAGMYDASLDQLRPFSWSAPDVWPGYSNYSRWNGGNCFVQAISSNKEQLIDEGPVYTKTYDVLSPVGIMRRRFAGRSEGYVHAEIMKAIPGTLFTSRMGNMDRDGVSGAVDKIMIRGQNSLPASEDVLVIIDGVPSSMADMKSINAQDIESITVLKDAEATALYGAKAAKGVIIIITKSGGHKKPAEQPQIRKNFNETAFFFPDLKTDTAGNISFGFTIPEALTQWKFQALAHTKDLAFGYSTMNVVTQKPLMVQPNAPRFLREGDKMELSAKVANMTGKELTGTVQLELFNAATNQPADGWFRNMYPVQYFTAEAGQSAVVKVTIDVPYQYNSALVYRFVAKAGDNSDGEEASLPVLTNSMLVTESMPLPMRGNAAKNFKFEKLLQSGNSETLQQHALTVEFTTNPAWYAVQALPYLADYPYECAEQTFNRYYANALATMIAGASPKLKAIVDKWNTTDTAALLSNLQKNEELKGVLLEETPWVLEAKTEAQQKKNIALLFDMVRMSEALKTSFEKLKQLQTSNGGFVWFKGGNDDRYITQYILSGIGHLKKLGALNKQQQSDWKDLIKTSLSYLDQRIKEDYDNLLKHKIKPDQNNLGYTQIQYLYLRSLFNEYDIPGASFTAINYYRKQSRQYWLQQSKYMQGMIALSLFRTGDIQTAKDILKSLKENAVVNEELGMYWKDNLGGYYWHQAPVETQSLLIEAFSEISKDNKTVDDLKTWLLKQKQVQDWKTTRATAEACYALLLQGSDWLNNTPTVEIRLGDKSISSATEQQEAGTGYFKKTIEGPFVNPSMGDISVRVTSTPGAASASSWGAVYWQYFEHLDKITPAATPLKLVKKLFVEKNTDRGPVLEPVAENAALKVGDKIKVRIELRVDRDMEYVHMKDMRASCMEPVNVLSGYQWQDGLGYYQSTKDASTSFFFGWLPKGTYVFEYPLFVTHTGNFSNGVTSIQCMYAPEFSAHSEGVRVNVE
jgi:TonB-dependent SusC/RagA subfamily outer membrane receptor